jgi:tetratricopeptide (TPR) repeat protein
MKLILTTCAFLFARLALNGQSPVTIEEKPLVIPTWQVAAPDKNPIFYTGRNYQGAQGHIYPLPLYDVLTDVRKDQTYKAVYLNNEYLELCILPELGGRIFSATDKTDQYDFFYRQHVIKPLLIGMTGAWIAGGVEWNIPDHHRATSLLPIDYTLVENPDGSKTAWVGESELSRGLKWMVGLTVYPGRSYVEATVKVFNPTPFIHPFLYWANVSVHCNENYQVIFPPNTQFGAQHAKGEFTAWPIGNGMYGGFDRTGVDLSWWKNHPNPASIFAWNFTDDFLAGYDFGKDAGTVHVANHHVVTGKKFFLWGNNAEARMWEKMFTETDGQYLELMVGAYSDNQPDYSWIGPGETRVFKQYWYPVKKIGGVKNANTEAAVNLERKSPSTMRVGFCTTSPRPKSRVRVTAGEQTILDEVVDINPASPFLKDIAVDSVLKNTDVKVSLSGSDGNELVSYSPVTPEKQEMPLPVEAPRSPADYKTIEELYLTALRIEQFRNAVIDPMPYYEEALRRDSLDYRVNTVLGIRFCKEGQYAEAEHHLRNAIIRSTQNYTRPKDGEAFYYLGVLLQLQNRFEEAKDEFRKATWYTGFQSAAWYRLAQLASLSHNNAPALELTDQSIAVNNLNTAALNLKTFILRKSGKFDKAREMINQVESIDKLDHWNQAERFFLEAAVKDQGTWSDENKALFIKQTGGNVQNVLELAKNYGNIGAYEEAVCILDLYRNSGEILSGFPLLSYYAGFYHLQNGHAEQASKSFRDAAAAMPDYCFPWRLEEVLILETALKSNPGDAKAWFYLGNIHYYLNQKEKAIADWEQSANLDGKFSLVWRNLGFAYDRVLHDLNKSMDAYDQAIDLNHQDPRLYAESDQIKERAGILPAYRLEYLQKHRDVLEKRDDAISRLTGLFILNGKYDEALDILTKRHFHVWEGGVSIHDLFEEANLLQGMAFLEKKQYAKALNSFRLAATWPDNLEEGEPVLRPGSVRINYYIALAYSGLNEKNLMADYFNQVAQYKDEVNLPELKFYKALALKKIGRAAEAGEVLKQIREFAMEEFKSAGETDFFAKFGDEDSSPQSRMAYNYYLLGLSYLGEGNDNPANENFRKSVELDQNQVWPKIMLNMKIKL